MQWTPISSLAELSLILSNEVDVPGVDTLARYRIFDIDAVPAFIGFVPETRVLLGCRSEGATQLGYGVGCRLENPEIGNLKQQQGSR
jgi:hypothetical protein